MATNQFPPDYKKTREEILGHLENPDANGAYSVKANFIS